MHSPQTGSSTAKLENEGAMEVLRLAATLLPMWPRQQRLRRLPKPARGEATVNRESRPPLSSAALRHLFAPVGASSWRCTFCSKLVRSTGKNDIMKHEGCEATDSHGHTWTVA